MKCCFFIPGAICDSDANHGRIHLILRVYAVYL